MKNLKKLLLATTLLTVIPFIAEAKVVLGKGEFIYSSTMSEAEACSRAENYAKQDAIQKVLGQRISAENLLTCTDNGNDSSCELNQFTWSLMEGHITSIMDKVVNDNPKAEGYRKCSVLLTADVAEQEGKKPVWDFRAETNKRNYVDGDELVVSFESTAEEAYVYLYQWLPYERGNNVISLYPIMAGTKKRLGGVKLSNTEFQIPGEDERYAVTFTEHLKGKKTIEDAYLMVLLIDKPADLLLEYNMESFNKKLHKIGNVHYQLVKLQYNILEE